MILHRLRNDFDLATVTVVGAVGLVGITPFAAYRYYTGNTFTASMDSAIVIGIGLALADAWLSGNGIIGNE